MRWCDSFAVRLESFKSSTTANALFSVGCVHTTDIAGLVARVNKLGTLIGSRLWGFGTEDSDWDYLIKSQEFPEIDTALLKNADKAYMDMPTLGFKLAYRSRYTASGVVVLNLLVCGTYQEFQAWLTCRDQMTWLVNSHPFIRDLCATKSVRVAIFEELRRRSGILADDDPGTATPPNILPFEPAKAVEPTWSAPIGVPTPDDDDEPPF